MAALENEGEPQKLRFGPWLLSAISSGNYRGLCWLDPERTTFRVPWKHNARKDITSSDLEIFKAWAEVSGRYEESSEDPAKWKTNFRCALRSTRMFKLLRDHSKCGDDPHKVFTLNQATLQHSKKGDFSSPDPAVDQQPAKQQLPVAGWAPQPSGVPTGTPQLKLHPQGVAPEIVLPGSTDPTQPMSLEKLLQLCDISPRDVVSVTPSWVPAGDILLQPHQDTLLQLHDDPSQNNCFPPTSFQQWVPMVEQPALGTYSPLDLMPPEELGAVQLPCHLLDDTVPVQSPGEAMFLVPTASAVPQPQPQHLVGDTGGFISNLDITIYYRGKEFHQEIVQGSHCLLTYQPLNLAVSQGPWHVVHFPSPASMADRKQWQLTERLLGKAGLQLEQRDYKIFATRREKCRVFWALSQQLEGVEDPPSNLLDRNQETPIFDFNEFSTELRDFRNRQRRRSPDFTIYLCFGQAFSKRKPKETKLILVKLVPKFCEYCYEKVLQEGASSLDSHTISLQLSDSFSLYDLIEQYTMDLD